MENDNNLIDTTLEQVPDSEIKIYSKKAIWGFSIFFSTIFGGILLMLNLKDIDRKKEANTVLIFSIIFTALTIFIVNIQETPNSSLTFLCNIVGGMILSEYFYKKYFPNDESYGKKKIWKPLIISIAITIPLILAMIYGM